MGLSNKGPQTISNSRRFETCALAQYCYLKRVGCSASACVRDEVARAKRPGKWSAHRCWRNFHESCRTSYIATTKKVKKIGFRAGRCSVYANDGFIWRATSITASVNAVLYTILMQINISKCAPVNFAQMPVFGLFPLVNSCG